MNKSARLFTVPGEFGGTARADQAVETIERVPKGSFEFLQRIARTPHGQQQIGQNWAPNQSAPMTAGSETPIKWTLLTPRLANDCHIRHSSRMAADAVNPSLAEPADFAGGLSKRVLRFFKAQMEDWYDVCRRLSAWEERHLVDQPKAEQLTEHERLLDELERVGRWMSLVTQSRDFPDRATADLVAMTLQDLQDRRALWHGNVPKERREEILRAVFHES